MGKKCQSKVQGTGIMSNKLPDISPTKVFIYMPAQTKLLMVNMPKLWIVEITTVYKWFILQKLWKTRIPMNLVAKKMLGASKVWYRMTADVIQVNSLRDLRSAMKMQ